MKAAFLPDRGVIKISGEDARHFLGNLVTADLGEVRPGQARFAALLTPQGKIIADFLVTEAPAGHGGGLLLDCPLPLADTLSTRLGFYKLRAKVAVENLSDGLGVLAFWDGQPAALPDLTFPDPRAERLGWRMLLPQDLVERAAALVGATLSPPAAYEAQRIACGVPKGGSDFAYGDAFPHETNMDKLAGVDFDKGCYVGQEVVSRMQHRGTARTRIVRVLFDAAPPPGSAVTADGKPVGTMGSSSGGEGLALLRLDRAAEALAAGHPLLAAGQALRLETTDNLPATGGTAA
jgi:folate-binding protein YgfZ